MAALGPFLTTMLPAAGSAVAGMLPEGLTALLPSLGGAATAAGTAAAPAAGAALAPVTGGAVGDFLSGIGLGAGFPGNVAAAAPVAGLPGAANAAAAAAPSFGSTLATAGKQFGMDTLKGIPINAVNDMRAKMAANHMQQPTSFQMPQLQAQAPPVPTFGDMRNLGQGNPFDQYMQSVFSKNPRL